MYYERLVREKREMEEEAKEFIKNHGEGKTSREIAEETGVSVPFITQNAKRMGVELKNMREPITQDEIDLIKKHASKNTTITEVSKSTGINRERTHGIIKKHNIDHKSGVTVWSKDDVEKVRQLHYQGLNQREIADKMPKGFGRGHVRYSLALMGLDCVWLLKPKRKKRTAFRLDLRLK